MPADYSRIHRLLRIMMLIQGETGWTAERLAQECGVKVRTIYRDMKCLEGAGIPYFYDSDTNGYQIQAHFFMPPVELTLHESLSLIAMAEHIGKEEQIPLTGPASKAIEKVRSQLPASVRQELEPLTKHITIDLARRGPVDGIVDVYDAMQRAIARKWVMLCEYESIEKTVNNKDTSEEFEFRPYALMYNQRAWYVVGLHGGRGELRTLKLNRFLQNKITNQTYTIPDDFKLDDYRGHAWRMIRGKKRYDVEIDFDAEFADTIAETHWHPTQEIEVKPDGSMTFRCKVDGLDEIVWWVLSMGPHCVVKKPKALADRVLTLAGEMMANYDGAKNKSKPAKSGQRKKK